MLLATLDTPRRHLLFWAATAHCQLLLNFLSTNTPRSFSSGLLLSQNLELGLVEVHPSPHPSLPRSLRMASLPCSVNYTIQIGAICTHHGLRKGQQAEEREHFGKKMEFWKSINGADQVFHQTLNLAIFCETFQKISPVVKQKPVLAICRGIYIPADWHKVRTEMLKYSIIFTTAGLLNFSSFPKTLLGPPWMPGADFC